MRQIPSDGAPENAGPTVVEDRGSAAGQMRCLWTGVAAGGRRSGALKFCVSRGDDHAGGVGGGARVVAAMNSRPEGEPKRMSAPMEVTVVRTHADLLKRHLGTDGWACAPCRGPLQLRARVLGAPATLRLLSGLRPRGPPAWP